MPQALPITRIHAAPSLEGPAIGKLGWSPDGRFVAYQRADAHDPGCFGLWICEARSGATPRVLLPGLDADSGGAITLEEVARNERQRQHASGVTAFAWSDCSRYLFATSRTGTCRIDITELTTVPVAPPSASDLQPAPKGGKVAYVKAGELWVASAPFEAAHRISPPAQPHVQFAVAEFIAQEEFARDTGYWWRPDGEAIAFTRVDEAMVATSQRIAVDVAGMRVLTQRFPRAGTNNAKVDLFVATLSGEQTIQIDLGDDPDIYLLRVAWSCDGHTLFIQRQSRDQRRIDLLAADPATGACRLIFEEVGTPWVNANLDFVPLSDGGFLWVSERSGINQLYRHAADGTIIALLTDAPVPLASRDRERGIAGVDEAAGFAYVLGGRDDAIERHLFRVALDGSRGRKPITTVPGWWTATMAPGGQAFAATHSSPDQPPHAALFAADGALLSDLEPNRLDASHPFAPFAHAVPEPEFGRLSAEDGQDLDYVMLRPKDFDPGRTYPAILHVYGGPGRQMVRKAWRPAEERAFLDAGYVLLQLDNRGACGRGKAFEAPISRKLGVPELEDQLVGLAFLRSLPFVDPQRIGAMGWSYGGFMTLRLMTDPRSGIRAGIAGGSVASWNDYDTHYTERYLGDPALEPEAYAAASLLPRLAQLQGRLMLVHGMSDDNVLFSHAAALMAELQRLEKPFDLMLYPGQGHSIVGQSAGTHKLRCYRDFFDRELCDDA